jgi:pimeloyl-ACP methyl ester carboxylesterase
VRKLALRILIAASLGLTMPSARAVAGAPFQLGGQRGWFHDPGFASGYFHTYDALALPAMELPPRKVHVFLPRDYETAGRRYPVVYANDGEALFFNGGFSGASWRLHEPLERLEARGWVQPIVVALVPNDRNLEYTHARVEGRATCCSLEAYARDVAGPVKAFVDAHYRTLPDSSDTIALGSSHGGLAAFFLATRHPNRVGAAVALSTSFWVGLDGPLGGSLSTRSLRRSSLMTLVGPTLGAAAARRGAPRLYLDWGLVRTGGFQNAFIEARATARSREMAALLRSDFGYSDAQLTTVEDPNGAHDEASWARRVEDALAAVLPRRTSMALPSSP